MASHCAVEIFIHSFAPHINSRDGVTEILATWNLGPARKSEKKYIHVFDPLKE